MKAEFMGTCQVCGRLQKLPAGKLSKHGYTLEWGFFSGVCQGSGGFPFEQSCDLIQIFIDQVRAQIIELNEQIRKLRTAPITADHCAAPFHQYQTSKRRGIPSGYREVEVAVVLRDGEVYLQFAGGKLTPAVQYCLYGTVENVVLSLRDKRVKRIDASIEQRRGYIAWQVERVRTWRARPLREVAA